MKIGILSDTHTKHAQARDVLDLLVKNGAEFIIHCGDIVQTETLELLQNCKKRYIAVYGNNDARLTPFHNEYNLVQEPHYFKLADTRFKLMHLPYYMTPDTEVVLFGHTHTFHSEFNNGTLFLNPGEVCAREKPLVECVMLEVLEKNLEVTYYKKELSHTEFSSEKHSYERIKK